MAKKDALSAFLSADLDVKETVHIKRLGVDLEVKPITGKTLDQLTNQATFANKVDGLKLNCLMVANACTSLNFGDPKMIEHYGASDPVDCVQKALFAGELTQMVQEILKVSGFENMDAQILTAKN
jgi:hypothetical protein